MPSFVMTARFTSALRTLRPDEAPSSLRAPYKTDRGLIAAKIRLLSGEMSWGDVCTRVSINVQARSDARQLRALVAAIQARDEAPAVIDDTCAFVFNTLRPLIVDDDVDSASISQSKSSSRQNALERVRVKLGNVTPSKLNELVDIVRKLSEVLSSSISPSSSSPGIAEKSLSSSFGSSVKVVIDDSLSDDDDVDVYIDSNPWQALDEQQVSHVPLPPSGVSSSYTLDRAWLGKTIASAFDGADIDVKDVTVSVFELLSSTRSSDDLQFALFELLGERYELIAMSALSHLHCLQIRADYVDS